MYKAKKMIIKFYPIIMPTAALINSLIIFLSGVGRFRVVVAIIVYFIVKIIFIINKYDKSTIEKLYLPLVAISLYCDIQYGQIFPIYAKANPVIAFLLVVVLDFMISKIIKKKVETHSDYNIFALCPKCNFEMNELTMKCENCNYSNDTGNNEGALPSNISPNISKITQLIALEEEESIVMQIKLDRFAAKSIFKNNNRLLLSYMIITNKKIALLKLKTFGRGWKYKEYVYMSDIISLTISKKYYINKTIPIIDIATKNNSIYGLYFIYFFSASTKLKDIASCILNINKNIVIIENK